MQMGISIVTNDTFSTHSHLRCKWWEFVIQMTHCQAICIKNPRVTTPQSHDTLAIVLQALTRSVVVINLSRYLQPLILTGYQKLKHYKHLITNIIVTRFLNQPHATLQIPHHTRRPTGTAPYSIPGQSTGGVRQVTFTTTTAVPLYVTRVRVNRIIPMR